MIDPNRTFVRVWATADRWRKVLGQPLKLQKATAQLPYDFYSFPSVPKVDKLTYVGGGATVYDAALDHGGDGCGASVENAAAIDRERAAAGLIASTSTKLPWPLDAGTPPAHTVSGTSSARSVYAPATSAQPHCCILRKRGTPRDAAGLNPAIRPIGRPHLFRVPHAIAPVPSAR
jgi:hypothetical protein